MTTAPLMDPTSPPPTAALQTSLTVLKGHSAPVTNVVWSPNGQFLATSAGSFHPSAIDATIRLWRADGTLIKILSGHSAPVVGLAWSADSQILASGSDDAIRLWRADGTLIATLHSAGDIQKLAWSPDSQTLASAITSSLGPVVQLWQRDGTPLAQLSTQNSGGKFFNLAWSPDGQFLLGGTIDYKVWRANGTEVFHLKKCSTCTPAWGMTWSPDSKLWAIGDEGGNVDVYDIEGDATAHLQNTKGNADALAWSPNGQILAGGDGVNLWKMDGSLQVTHASFGRVNSLAWSPDGQLLASGSSGNGLRLWNADGQLLAAFPGEVSKVAWSPDGQQLAVASDNTIQLWQVRLTLPRP